jgi:hypothetical protein
MLHNLSKATCVIYRYILGNAWGRIGETMGICIQPVIYFKQFT